MVRSFLRRFLLLGALGAAGFPGLLWAADGTITRIQGGAEAVRQGRTVPMVLGGAIERGDLLRTGIDARLEFKMSDGTVITLGERAQFAIDEYAFSESPAPSGKAGFRLGDGAFRAVTGKIAELAGRPFQVRTPVVTIGIRGTDFWGGPTQGEFGVLLLGGKGVIVTNDLGRVELTEIGLGTATVSGQPPGAPGPWSAERAAAAAATVTFR